MMTQIPDIAFEIDGDLVRIEQSAGCGEVTSVDLHRLHLRHLAELMGSTSGAGYQQERALLRLWGKLFLLADSCYLDEIVERCGGGLTYQAHALDARNILADILEDLGIDVPTFEDEEAARASNDKSPSPRNDKSGEGISVTPSQGRGRPSTGTALSNAERQAKHRARQAELLPVTTVAN